MARLSDPFSAVAALPDIRSRPRDTRQILERANSRGDPLCARTAACGGDSRSTNSRFGGTGPGAPSQPAWEMNSRNSDTRAPHLAEQTREPDVLELQKLEEGIEGGSGS